MNAAKIWLLCRALTAKGVEGRTQSHLGDAAAGQGGSGGGANIGEREARWAFNGGAEAMACGEREQGLRRHRVERDGGVRGEC